MQRGAAFPVDLNVHCLDIQCSAINHRIPSVDGQIHDDLLNLIGVCHNLSQGRIEMRLQCDVLADQAFQHRHRFPDRRVQVENLWLDHLLTTER